MLNSSDPIFENVFDGVQLRAQPQGTKGAMKTAMNPILEFQALVAEREAGYKNLDQFFTALLQYAVHVDDLFDGDEEERKQAIFGSPSLPVTLPKAKKQNVVEHLCTRCEKAFPKKPDCLALQPVRCDACTKSYHLTCAGLVRAPKWSTGSSDTCSQLARSLARTQTPTV